MADTDPLVEPEISTNHEVAEAPRIPKVVGQGDGRRCYFPHRYRLLILLFMATLLVCTLRASFNLALVAMVNMTSELNTSDECPITHPDNSSTSSTAQGEFNWNADTQGLLLSSFYYGYVVMQLPGGYIGERFGAKRLILATILLPGLLNLAIPQLAYWSVDYVIAVRVLMGLIQGAMYPGIYAFWARWAPSSERTLLVGGSASGLVFGELIAFGVSGVLCSSTFLGGWPSVFYLFGGTSVLWCLFWLIFAHDTPAKDPTISTTERLYIEAGTGSLDHAKYQTPPYLSIFTSPPVLAGTVVSFTDSFAFYVLFSSLPIYMRQILRFSIAENGLMTTLPCISAAIGQVLFPPLVDFIRAKSVFSNTVIRRTVNTVGTVGAAALFAMIPLAGCHRLSAIALLMTSTFLNAAVIAAYQVNSQDLAPQYAGTICGLGNMVANFCGFLAPLVVEALTGETPSISGWNNVFYFTAGISTFGGIVFLLFGSGERQKWAEVEICQLNVTQVDWQETEEDITGLTPAERTAEPGHLNTNTPSIQNGT